MQRSLAGFHIVLGTVLSVSMGCAFASAPANDNIRQAVFLGSALPITVTATNVGASLETNEPQIANSGGTSDPGGSSVWYTFKATSNAVVAVSLLGSDYDTLLAVYSDTDAKQQPNAAPGAFSTLTLVASNDDFGGTLQSKLTFQAITGVFYRIQIDGVSGAQGNIGLNLQKVVPPANDNFASAIDLSGIPLPITTAGTNSEATPEVGEPSPFALGAGLSVWWKWTAPSTGKFTVATLGSNFDTTLGIYTGSAVASLTQVGANDNILLNNLTTQKQTGTSQITLNALSGTVYFIQVDGSTVGGVVAAEQGNITLNIHAANSVVNDDFANAIALAGPLPIIAAGSNLEGTVEAGEPIHAGNTPLSTVWWSWTAQASGKVTVSTEGSTFDTVLGVYTGSAVGSLTSVAANDDFGADLTGTPVTTSQVSFTASAGTMYNIAVSGHTAIGDLAEGAITLSLLNPPANDDFANAISLSGAFPLYTAGSNQFASKETGEPVAVDAGGQSVWWNWTATTTGSVTISTAGSGFATNLAVYTGTAVNALTLVSSSLNFGGNGASQVTFIAQAGQMYRISVDGVNASSGAIILSLVSPPANDNFAAAIPLAGAFPIVTTGTNQFASKEAGEPIISGSAGGSSVWWSFTAPATQKITVSTEGSNFDTLLAVYTGASVAALTNVASNDNFGNANQSQVVFSAVAGTVYMIAVDGVLAKSGNIKLTVTAPPANDDFANAAPLTGLPVTANGSNHFAGKETGEPKHAGSNGGDSVWWSWQSGISGNVTISTQGSSFITLLGIYTGSAVNALTLVGSNFNSSAPGRSQVTFSAVNGTTYLIAVDGASAASGAIVLTVTSPPANDNFANATVLSGTLPINASGTNRFASKEPGEPAHAADQSGSPAGGASVWWNWTAPANGKVVLTTSGSSFDTLLAVYTGTNVVSLTPIASNDNFGTLVQSQVGFDAIANTAYSIAVDGRLGDTGSISLALRSASAPANDNFANATPLSGALPIVATGSNIDASKETGEPSHAADAFGFPPGGSSVWWSWTSTVNGRVSISTFGSTFTTLLAVYTGPNVATLTEENSSQRGQLSLLVVAGTTYYIAVDGVSGATGMVNLTLATPPANDDFTNAIVLSGPLPIATTGSNVGATIQRSTFTTSSPEPLHAGNLGGSSVWWVWTAPSSNQTTISTFGSTFDTILGVYTGPNPANLKTVVSNDNTIGKTSEVTFSAQAGTTYVIAVDGFNTADSSGKLGGAATGNIALKIRGFALPDLQIQSISHTPANPIPGQTVNFAVTLLNNNAGDAGTFDTAFFMNMGAVPSAKSTPDLIQTASALGGGSTTQLTFTLVAPAPGTYTAWAFADFENEIVESDKSNNAGPLPAGHVWTVVPAPSAPLINGGNTVSSSGVAGQPFSFDVPVTGTGPYTLSGNLPAGLSFSGTTISGTPLIPGTFVLPITATNSTGSSSVVMSFIIADPLDLDGDGFSNELEIALGSSPTDPASTPFAGQNAGTVQPLGISLVKMKLDFTGKKNNDSLQISGFFPVAEGVPIAQTLVLDFGGVVKSFTLDAKGAGPKGNDTIKATIKGGAVNFSIKLNKGNFSDALKDEGLTGDKDVVKIVKQVATTILFNKATFRKNPQFVQYSAKKGQTGSFNGIGTDNAKTGISGIAAQ